MPTSNGVIMSCCMAICLMVCDQAVAEPLPIIHMYVFRSNDCPHCASLEEEELGRLAEQEKCQIVPHYFNVDDPKNYERLVLLEQTLHDEGNDLPVVFAGGRVLGGIEEINRDLKSVIEEFARSGGAGPMPIPSDAEIAGAHRGEGPAGAIYATYFEKPGCHECQRINHMLHSFESSRPSLKIARMDFSARDHKVLLEVLCERALVPQDKRLIVPALFIGSDALIGPEVTDGRVDTLLRKYEAAGAPAAVSPSGDELAAARDRLVARVQSFGFTAVIAGGLVDGVNPCAFGTVIFLVAYLASLGKTRGRILLAGLAFCAGAFLGYLAIGIGLSEALLQFQAFRLLALILRWSILGLVIVLALMSFYDAWIVGRGEPRSMLLKMPSRLRSRMLAVISRRCRSSQVLAGSFLLGCTLSVIEFVCTGQVYLPLIQLMLSLSVDRLQTFCLLLVYNAAFSIPLLAVLGAVFLGARSERLNFFFQRYMAGAKILLGLFFSALAAALLFLG